MKKGKNALQPKKQEKKCLSCKADINEPTNQSKTGRREIANSVFRENSSRKMERLVTMKVSNVSFLVQDTMQPNNAVITTYVPPL